MKSNNSLIICKCGCSQKRLEYDNRGRKREFINFHRVKRLNIPYPSKSNDYKLAFYHLHKGLTRPYVKRNIGLSRYNSNYMKNYYERFKVEKFGFKNIGKGMPQERNPNWKGGKAKCIDCGNVTSSYDSLRCRSCADKYYIGNKNHQWKHGLSKLTYKIKVTKLYYEWRRKCLIRDNFTCQECGNIGYTLEVHHKKSFISIFLKNKIKTMQQAYKCKELWDINNGKTLCIICHNKTKGDISCHLNTRL